MNIMDAIKKSVLEGHNTALGAGDIVLSLLIAALISLLIIAVYRKTFSGIVYSRGTALTMLLITLTTAMIIRTINSNLSLSLGMVGALSIVRFRTAIKEPVDTAFLFWSITAGIMSGAGLYFLAVLGSLGIAFIYCIVYTVSVKSKKQYLLILHYAADAREAVEACLAEIAKAELRSKNESKQEVEATYLVNNDESLNKAVEKMKEISGVENINIIAYSNDYGM